MSVSNMRRSFGLFDAELQINASTYDENVYIGVDFDGFVWQDSISTRENAAVGWFMGSVPSASDAGWTVYREDALQ